MANDCAYCIKAVSPKKESLERLLEIMRYHDNEFFIYRVFDAIPEDITQEGDLYSILIYGSVGWSSNYWFNDDPDPNDISRISEAHYTSFKELCPLLNIGVESFGEESGMGFQEHLVMNHEGKLVTSECADWDGGSEADDDDDDDDGSDDYKERERAEGLENFMCWSSAKYIYHGKISGICNKGNPVIEHTELNIHSDYDGD